jgi:hypothetical protein
MKKRVVKKDKRIPIKLLSPFIVLLALFLLSFKVPFLKKMRMSYQYSELNSEYWRQPLMKTNPLSEDFNIWEIPSERTYIEEKKNTYKDTQNGLKNCPFEPQKVFRIEDADSEESFSSPNPNDADVFIIDCKHFYVIGKDFGFFKYSLFGPYKK